MGFKLNTAPKIALGTYQVSVCKGVPPRRLLQPAVDIRPTPRRHQSRPVPRPARPDHRKGGRIMTAIRFAAIDDIGPTIRQLRKAKHWSQEQLAKEAGVSKATVTFVENGDRIPHTPKLRALLWALGYELTAVPQ